MLVLQTGSLQGCIELTGSMHKASHDGHILDLEPWQGQHKTVERVQEAHATSRTCRLH